MSAVRFEPLDERDLDAVAAGEAESTRFPWSRQLFAEALHAGYRCWGMWEGQTLIGHGIVLHVLDEAHLLVITVRPPWQGQGLGGRLLEHLADSSREHGAVQMFLEVRDSNRVARALYAGHGFAAIGQRRAYYPDADGRREDAVVMQRNLG